MKPKTLALTTLIIALTGCDEGLVRFDPAKAPTADNSGLHVAVEQFIKSSTSIDAWVKVTNQSSSPITLKAPTGQAFWAAAVSNNQMATIQAIRWGHNSDYDDVGGEAARVLGSSYTILPSASREIEIYGSVPQALSSNHEPWVLTLFIQDHGSMVLPLDSPPVASK
jgi:hypothetical protein